MIYTYLNGPDEEVLLRPLEGVRDLRNRQMLSQQELADRAGVSLFTVQRIERGDGNVRPKTGRAIAEALGVRVEDLLGKAQAPLPDFEDERRLHYLRPWADYIYTLANNAEREIEQGHITDLNWAQEFNRDVITLTHLYNRLLPPPQQQTEGERVALLEFSGAIDRLNEVADQMDRAMEPVIAEMHREMYAREREERKAALQVIHGRLSA
jgi:transcriptional regulator with XRE-family HTH domain